MARITIDQAPAWVGLLGEGRRRAALRGVRAAGDRLIEHIVADVIPREPRAPVDRGTYRAAWRSTPTSYGALVHNDAPHAGFIEDGVRGDHVKIGRALIDALVEWVTRKGLVADRPGESRAASARQIAWAIAKSMQQRGIFNRGGGLKILEKARRRVRAFLAEEVARELGGRR